jgi:hypothetical protein
VAAFHQCLPSRHGVFLMTASNQEGRNRHSGLHLSFSDTKSVQQNLRQRFFFQASNKISSGIPGTQHESGSHSSKRHFQVFFHSQDSAQYPHLRYHCLLVRGRRYDKKARAAPFEFHSFREQTKASRPTALAKVLYHHVFSLQHSRFLLSHGAIFLWIDDDFHEEFFRIDNGATMNANE